MLLCYDTGTSKGVVMKNNEYTKKIGKFRLSFTVPLKTIKNTKCWFCDETGDLNWVAKHLEEFYLTDHFGRYTGKRRNSRNGFEVIEKA